LKMFVDETLVSWSLLSGVNIPNVRVTSGKVYWTEIHPGYYTIRFFPNLLGLWRVILEIPSVHQTASLTYEVTQRVTSPFGSGMKTSFYSR
jgi:hypothetical protein